MMNRSNTIVRIQIYSALIAGLCLLAIIIGQVGYKLWFFDLPNHFLPYWVAAVCVLGSVSLFLTNKRWGFVFLSVAIIFILVESRGRLIQRAIPEIASEDSLHLRIISYNVLSSNTSQPEVLSWIQAHLDSTKTNVVFLMEVSPEWVEALAPLSQKLGYFKLVPQEDNFGVAIYSNKPLEELEIKNFDSSGVPAISALIEANGKKIRFIGVHPIPPLNDLYFNSRNKYYLNLKETALGSNLPTIIAGDFNSAQWSPNFRSNFGSFQNIFSGFFRPHTWQQGFLSMPIDHVLFNGDLILQRAEIGPHMGSDHRPLVVDF